MHAYLKRAQFTISACTSTSENEFKENMQVTRVQAKNPNFQVVIMHLSHICSQHSFGLYFH